jgi:hypothetical protein
MRKAKAVFVKVVMKGVEGDLGLGERVGGRARMLVEVHALVWEEGRASKEHPSELGELVQKARMAVSVVFWALRLWNTAYLFYNLDDVLQCLGLGECV